MRVAAQRQRLLAGGRVPYLERCVIAAGDEAFTVGAECQASDRMSMPVKLAEKLPGLRVPKANDTICAGRRQNCADGGKDDIEHGGGVRQGKDLCPCGRVPKPDGAVAARRGK